MSQSSCPHCGASENYAAALFCQHCHKAVPTAGMVFKIIIVVVLCRSIAAAAKAREIRGAAAVA